MLLVDVNMIVYVRLFEYFCIIYFEMLFTS